MYDQNIGNTRVMKYSKEESETLGLNLDQIRLDYNAQITQLEQKELELETQLEQVKNLRAKLEPIQAG